MFFLFVMFCLHSTGRLRTKQYLKRSKAKTNVGGSCEGCEAVFESPVPFDKLNNVDTLPDFNDRGSQN